MSTVAPPRPPARPPLPPEPVIRAAWRSRLPWHGAEAKAAPGDDLATLCLFLVSLAVALSLGRLFRGTTWLPYGVAAAGLGHAMAWGLRRLGAGLTTASLASALLSLLVAIELVVPQATTYGVPTPFTFEVLGQALSDAQSSFRSAVAPVVPAPGFLAATVVGVCMCAFLADWAAFRMRTAFEACVPGLALFVFASVLGAKSHRGVAVAGFAAAALVFLIVQRANLEGGHTAWFGGRDHGALPSLLGSGALLGAIAVLGALVLSPMVPGSSSKALLSFKKTGAGAGSGTRSTVSPLVDIQSRLREYANVDVFTVKADQPAYWRLTSLDQFDGSIWSSNERYAANRGQLTPASGLSGTRLVQEVTISTLSSIWLPGAYRPASVAGVGGLSYSPGSASLITRKDTSDGLTYSITSVLPDLSAEQLRQAQASAPGRSELGADYGRYTSLGGSPSRRLRQLATQLSARKATPYDKALAIQEHFRSGQFEYSLDVQAGHSGSAIDRFLFETRVGYCEQFAGSYAVLARLMGLPTRVAVGFQPGARSADGVFGVQDKDAHAWPEVYLEGVGWTAFEPTPTAGNPQAQAYTGAPYTEATRPNTEPTTATTAPAPAPATPSESSPAPLPEEDDAEAADPGAPEERGLWSKVLGILARSAPLWLALGGLGAAAAASAAFVSWERRTRRRRAGAAPEGRVHMAWEESLDALALAGVRRRPAETVDELLHRLRSPAGGAALAGVERGTTANEALVRLGGAVAQSAYTARNVAPAVADAAEADRNVIVAACRRALGRWGRLSSDLDIRPPLARLRAIRAATRPPEPDRQSAEADPQPFSPS